MPDFSRALIFVLMGLALLAANIWFILSLHGAYFQRAVVITPFQITGLGRDDDKLGGTLAAMLQRRLRQIQRDLNVSQRALTDPVAPTGTAASTDPGTDAIPLWPTPSVDIPTALFDPLDIDVTVGGVEVGGLLSWAHRALARPRFLAFTVHFDDDRAVITGDLDVLFETRGDTLWLESEADPTDIADKISYALIQRKLSEDKRNKISSLEVDEVQSLLTTMFRVAELNRKIALGRKVEGEFASNLPPLEALVPKVPRWYELTYLTGNVAESSGNTRLALSYYRQVKHLSGEDGAEPADPILLQRADAKIAALTPAVAAPVPLTDKQAAFVKEAREYAQRLKLQGPDPEIVFLDRKDQALAVWSTELHRYEVSNGAIDTPDLARYVAIQGRFMANNYDRCFGKGATGSKPPLDIWNDFRWSATNYLTSTEPDAKDTQDSSANNPYARLFKVFKRMEASPGIGTGPVRRLALTLMETFQCDWTRERVQTAALAINEQQRLMPDEVIRDAFASETDAARP